MGGKGNNSSRGAQDDIQETISKYKWHVCGGCLLSFAIIYFATERWWLQSEQRALASEIAAGDGLEEKLASVGFMGTDGSAYGIPPENLPEITAADCIDKNPDCRSWAASGECLNNAQFMIGNIWIGTGTCLVSCGMCGNGVVEESSTAGSPNCKDLSPNCMALKDAGRCEEDPIWMMGDDSKEGKCRRTCGACYPVEFKANFDAASQHQEALLGGKKQEEGHEATWQDGASFVVQGRACQDLSRNCQAWADQGMCEDNRSYMVGSDSHEGQCRRTCKACKPKGEEAAEDHKAPRRDTPLERIATTLEKTPLQWPVKVTADKKVCIGLTTVACQRGLWTPEFTLLQPKDRSRVSPGIGGPTGCKEAWGTLLQQEDDLPGVLVQIYTIRKYSKTDRDILVFVAGNVSQDTEKQLQDSCVQVLRIAEPYDPKTHIGFNKMSMWLAEEYEKIAFFSPTIWFRENPDEMFSHSAPAAVLAPRHPRVRHEVYNAGAFVLKPSRETFFDMVTKAGTIDSAEKMEDGSIVFLDTLFFTGYFVHWKTISAALVEHQQSLVASLHHEAANARLHTIITSMPPYSPYTMLNYKQIQASGIQNSISVPPWQPGWRIPCAYPCSQRSDQHLWEAISEEWWHYYYDLVGFELPSSRSAMRLLEPHDPLALFDKKEHEHCLPINCEVPNQFSAQLDAFEDVLRMVKESQTSAILTGKNVGRGRHRRQLMRL